MNTHTPGPWKSYGHKSGDFFDVCVTHIDKGISKTVCVIRYASEADLRLILAAPQLLEACKTAVEFFRPKSGLPEDIRQHFLSVVENDPVLKAIRAAIAAATGETT